METNINYTIVGAFVISLTAALILAIVWLSSGFSFELYSKYLIYMQESVTGLNIDSAVEYNGVSVGTVDSIELNRKNPQLVEVLVSIKTATPITHGTVAMLSSKGITGITYIALQDKSTDLRPLVALKGQPYPVIRTIPSIFTRLDTALSQLSKSFRNLSETFQSVFDKQTQQAIKNTFINLNRVTSTLAVNSQKLGIILDNTSKASQQFSPLVQSSMGAVRTLETQTLPETYQLLNNLNDTVRTLSEVSEQLKSNPSILIRGQAPAVLGPGETK